MPYNPKNWQREPITKANLNQLEQAVANAVAVNENHVGQAAGAHAATAISYAGSANLSATTVEAALDELDTEKAGVGLANTFTQRQTFQGGLQDGDGNQDISWLYSLGIALDTRTVEATAWNADDMPTTLVFKDGVTVVATMTIVYNTDNRPTSAEVVAGGKTITYTITWTNGTKYVSTSKVVA